MTIPHIRWMKIEGDKFLTTERLSPLPILSDSITEIRSQRRAYIIGYMYNCNSVSFTGKKNAILFPY